MANRNIPVKGLAELDKYLSYFAQNLQKAAYRSALVAAAKPVRDEARLLAPKKTGKMAKSIRTGSPRQNQDGTFSIQVSLSGNDHAFLGLFMEYGVAPHFISPGTATEGGKKLSARQLNKRSKQGQVLGEVSTGHLKIGENIISGTVFHPGFAPKPFMRPALDLRAGDAVEAFRKRLQTFIEGKTGFAAPLDEAA